MINSILTVISIFITGVVGFILKNQIESQKTQIGNLELYIKTIDWKKVKEFYEDFYLPSEKLKAVQPHLDEKQELINYVRWVVSQAIKLDVDINKFVESNLPHCREHFQDLIDLNVLQRNSETDYTVHFEIPPA